MSCFEFKHNNVKSRDICTHDSDTFTKRGKKIIKKERKKNENTHGGGGEYTGVEGVPTFYRKNIFSLM